ncbi:hypothetical protein PHYSODRAFT_533672 [Phytophthora sojae]|uniref:Protein kinase domain-containing protein n=1 Tax=Phytophthora sojae (strain P6497) TaxID=1094619 RepID=G5AG24_PHYSP|nr:hypothetical protein PHYSODRAFT_533672 [Phytophthora sojae]EGZ05536.1 hypothetical protein PHYSODRAFT_533672 [Phytophthora sojae]|eukprot:XP_009539067.1 hypothetical protein PHYSODRAFT_533672 [Phytophthora sojae]
MDPTASTATRQKFYDGLLRIPTVLLHSRGLDVTQHRSRSRDAAGENLRPDVIVHLQGLVVLRGEEADTRVWLGTPRARLATKMREWSRMFYGDLPYTLGYVTSGDWLGIVVVGEDLYAGLVLQIRSIRRLVADAIKVFYNLPFLLERMITVSKFRRLTQLTPYTPVEGEKCTIELVDGAIERTIERRQCEDDEAFERLVCIYKTLQDLGNSNDTERTHLQTVESLELHTEYKLVVRLTPLGSCREPVDVKGVREWVTGMLTALSFWHGCNYCHGDVCWRNIVHVPDGTNSGRWVLIDMDESRRPETTTIEWNHPCEGEQLTFRHDLLQLGKLFKQLHPTIKLPRDLLAIRDKLLGAMEDPSVRAQTVAVMLKEE